MREDVAIVGIACRYPDSEHAGAFWENLANGRSGIKEVTADHWSSDTFYSPDGAETGQINSKWIGGLGNSRDFDHAFFSISPREAVALDPQHRLLLEEAWHCLVDSGLPIDLLRRSRTSVNIALSVHDHLLRSTANNKRVDVFDPLGNYHCLSANRISYFMDLHGPSRAVDTACSSSLVALSNGRQDLLHEGCDFAFVGGVNLVSSPWRYLAFTQSRMLSPDGRCFTFDSRANGYVPGEGVGVVLLTTLSNAERLGCHVYGVLKGIATNHNGRNRTITAPSVPAQVDVISRALADARIEPARVTYVEAHGTGTSLGDPIEIEALDLAYARQDRTTALAVGSVKTNIGHVEAGAGLAGLIKVLLMLRNRTIAPTLNIERVNPLIENTAGRIEFPSDAVPWTGEGPLTAGISSFGFGGVNCHAIVSEYEPNPLRDRTSGVDAPVFTLAAKTPAALTRSLADWSRHVRSAPPEALAGLCRASNQRDLTLPYRFAAHADDLVTALTRPDVRHCEGRPELAVLLAAGPFASHVAALRALAERDVHGAELVALCGNGAAAALVHSGMMSISAATDALAGDGVLIASASPSTAVHIGEQLLLPNEITADYLAALGERCARSTAAVTGYVAQAAGLLGHQHTFTRALSGWVNPAQAHGVHLMETVQDFATTADSLTPEHRAMIALAIDVAHTEIDDAWGLTPAGWLDEGTHELANLVRRGILSPTTALDLLAGTADLAAVAAQARDHRDVRSTVLADLPLLRQHTAGRHAGLRILTDVKWDYPQAVRADCLAVVGDLTDPPSRSVRIDTATATAFAASLIGLWLAGCAVDWAGPQTGVERIPGLPGYSFDQHEHRHEDAEFRFDGREPAAAAEPLREHEVSAPAPPPLPQTTTDAPDDLAADLRELLRELVGKGTRNQLAAVLPDTEFADLGIDSLIIHSLNGELSQRFGDVPVTLFFECRDIRALADRVLRDHRPAVAAHFAAQRVPEDAAPRPVPSAPPVATQRPGHTEPGIERPAPPVARRRHDRTDAGRPIAIIGLDARFPGADTLDEFWAGLCAGTDSITEVPRDRWDHDRYFDPRRGVPGKVYAKWGGFLSDVDRFDASAFGIAPSEARFMDPQERLFLESAYGCLVVAGYDRERLRTAHDNEVGVFAGASFNNYQLIQHEADLASGGGPNGVLNSQTYAIANRVSFTYDLRGPSLTLDTACSSSLYAVHMACESLRRGECELAIAGGVNLSLHPSKFQMMAHYRFLSSDGRCRAFGAGGDGYVPAETVGAFLLKPLEAAERDGDRIYGVIRGSALTHGGRTTGFTVPNPAAQALAIERALRQAAVDPGTISYVEAHGTGTQLGDPIEIAGITAAFGATRKQYCAVGSVKSNIGHGEAAAGVAQIAKVVLQMQHRTLVPSLLHSDRTNPSIDFANSPVYVQRSLEEWNPARTGLGDVPLRAGVSSIGAGGTNVHLVLEEYRG
ncbi:beta-ketoacyl synthase N-terminal-like domain-containing protein [Lentzea sp. HUAS12]|uniref:beta-ketoacyl synthase N-terminal-like domain-containing protein n=1 Tax=Lentzea sp. HUAS12 TaxID=2951806 RepID=UPI00209EAE03|nr:beta-ketoacyl synthase N-terminal-like domain-containing protein [Lentzea sp. HUAS12]USX56207.1 phosphopantetheine-binding protein [Lentzea sp. HUAS12]